MRILTPAERSDRGPTLPRWVARFPAAVAVVVATVGCVALAGWISGVSVLRSGIPGLVDMKVDTAACFVLVSVALWLLAGPRPRARPVALVLCAIVAFVALVTLSEYVLGRSLGIDLLLFHHLAVAGADAGTPEPGRMTPDKAVAFLLLAGALTALDTRRSGRWLPSGLAVGAALVAFVPLLGDVHGITAGYVVSDLVAMVVPAYAAFIALAAAILCARPFEGAMRLVLADTLGGRVMRLLVPMALGVPIVLGALRVAGWRGELLESDTGAWVFALAVMCGLAWSLDRAERASRRALAAHHEVQRERRAFEEAPIGGVLVSCEGRFMRVNRAFCAMVGYPAEELIGMHYGDITHPDDRPTASVGALAALVDGSLRVHHVEKRYVHRDGSLVHARVAVTPIYEQSGEVSQLYAQMQDVTESTLAAKRLEDAQFETLAVLAAAAEYRDDETGEHTRRVGATASTRRTARPPRRDGAFDPARRAPPRHRQDRHPRRDPAQARPADRRRVRPHEAPHHDRRADALRRRLSSDRAGRADRKQPPRALGRDRLPAGLAGDAIPIAGRIVAVADVFDALTHARPYKDAWPLDQAREELQRQRGRQFDPDVIDAFFKLDSRTGAPRHPNPYLPPRAAPRRADAAGAFRHSRVQPRAVNHAGRRPKIAIFPGPSGGRSGDRVTLTSQAAGRSRASAG